MPLTEDGRVPLAIIGMGCLFPRAGSLADFWGLIREGKDGITEVPATHWRPEEYFDADPKARDRTYARRGGFLAAYPFKPLDFGIAPADLEATDTAQLLGIVVAQAALEDAGYPGARNFDRGRVSCIMGVTGTLELVIPLGARLGHPVWRQALKDAGVEASVAADVMARIESSYVGWQENSFPGLLGNVVAGRIANRLNLGGTNCVVDAACASSLSALHLASMELQSGRADMVVTGGVDTFNDIFMFMCFSKTPALSPTGDARPLAKNADGTILGEGIGAVVLKRLDDALRDGDPVHAVLRGIGTSSDGKGQAIYAPSADGQIRCLRDAYERAGVDCSELGLIEAHGTGTKVGDAVELSALQTFFGAKNLARKSIAIGSVKSQIGHTKAAAGIAGLIKAALAVELGVIPPTLKVDEAAGGLDDGSESGASPFYVPRIARPWTASSGVRRAGVSAFGFGGSNFHCVIESAPVHAKKSAAASGRFGERDVVLLTYGENSRAEVFAALAGDAAKVTGAADGALVQFKQETAWRALKALSRLRRGSFNAKKNARLVAVILRDGTEHFAPFAGRIASEIGAGKNELRPLRGGHGFWFREGVAADPIATAALFPGQGAQYPGMFSELATDEPCFRAELDGAARIFAANTHAENLIDILYPVGFAPSNEAASQHSIQRLTTTQNAQPAIGAVSAGAFAAVARFGFAPAQAVGHSFGELTALYAAGVLCSEDFHRAACARGRFMGKLGQDLGGMLAVKAARSDVAALIKSLRLDVVIANDNAPDQVVVAGPEAALRTAGAAFGASGWGTVKLAVGAAFHSSLVAGAAIPFAAELAPMQFMAPRFSVISNTTAEPYPVQADGAKRLLAAQLAKPVEFRNSVTALFDRGARLFVEIGPGARLTGLAKRILQDRAGVDFVTLDRPGEASGTLALASFLAELAVRGVALNLRLWDEASDAPAAQLANQAGTARPLIVPIVGANYVKPGRPVLPPRAPLPENPPATATFAPPLPPRSRTIVPPPEPKKLPAKTLTAKVNAMTDQARDANWMTLTQETLRALHEMQKQTAAAHLQFLDGQLETQRLFFDLLSETPRQMTALPRTLPAPEEVHAPAAVRQHLTPQPRYSAPSVATAAVPPKTVVAAPIARVPVTPIARIMVAPKIDAPAANAVSRASLEALLLGVIAEKTGYPADMLALQMSLEGDLGIDSIKRVEIFSELAAKNAVAGKLSPDELASLSTLAAIVDRLSGAPEPRAAQAARGETNTAAQAVLDVVSEKTGYPADMLSLTMQLEADLGIDSIKRVEIFAALQEKIPAAKALPPEFLQEAKSLEDIVRALAATDATNATVSAGGALSVSNAQGIDRYVLTSEELAPPNGLLRGPEAQGTDFFLLASQDDLLAGALQKTLKERGFACSLITWDGAAEGQLRFPAAGANVVLFATDLSAEPSLGAAASVFFRRAFAVAKEAAGRCHFFATVTRIDGEFGFAKTTANAASIAAAVAGGLSGLAKSAQFEWSVPATICRAFDVHPASDASGNQADAIQILSAKLTDEILSLERRPLETGIAVNSLSTPVLVKKDLASENVAEQPVLALGELVVVTGGARGVTADVVRLIGAIYQPQVLILARTPLPATEVPELAALDDEAAIKKYLMATAPQAPSPRELKTAYGRLVDGRAIRANLAALMQTGATVDYVAVDVREAAAVYAAIQAAVDLHGPVRVVLHGAGVLQDRLIADKTDQQVDAVVGTKIGGLLSLVAAIDPAELRALVLFSSSTGRFGRKGQSDYAVANEALNKIAQSWRATWPHCRALAINWGPWDGGMVTPALRALFSAEGIEAIGLEAGAAYLASELQQRTGSRAVAPAEIVILGKGSRLPESVAGVRCALNTSGAPHRGELTQRISVAAIPALLDHVLAGRAVLPAALMIDLLAAGAVECHAGLVIHGLENFRVLKGVTLGEGDEVIVTVRTDDLSPRGASYTAEAALTSERDGRPVLHAAATIILGDAALPAARSTLPLASEAFDRDASSLYEEKILFHGDMWRCLNAVHALDAVGLVAEIKVAAQPGHLVAAPWAKAWLVHPEAIDAVFQAVIVWSHTRLGACSLPASCEKIVLRRPARGENLSLVLSVRDCSPGRVCVDADLVDQTGHIVLSLQGVEATVEANLAAAFAQNRLPSQIKALGRPGARL